jgi:hypothetical protein
LQDGRGKLTKKNGDLVEGVFRKGQPHGECVLRFADGSKFKGHFKDGKRHGPAIEEDKNGLRFEGSYAEDVRDGHFIEKDRNGRIVAEGTYTRGHRSVN